MARRTAGAVLFALAVVLGWARAASAEPMLLDVSTQPVVLIQHSQPVWINTWDRNQISVDAGGEQPVVERRPGRLGSTSPLAPYSVPIPSRIVPGPGGQQIVLGAEDFPVQLPPGQH